MYRKLFLAHPVSHHLYARPWEATGHRRPREATGGHRRPREATGGHGPHPTVPPKILYLLKWAGRGRQKGRLRRKPATGGHGGPRGATGGHGAAQKKSRNTNRPLQYPRGPLQAVACLGKKQVIRIVLLRLALQKHCTSALLLGPTGTKTERERETFLIVITGELLSSLKGRENPH